jgi:hypothetical protein
MRHDAMDASSKSDRAHARSRLHCAARCCHWASGGPTTLSNLAMLCRRHHRAVHEEGYDVERQSDGALRFRRPDGRAIPDVPDRPAMPHDPVQALRARHAAQGLSLHSAGPEWLAERLDVSWAIDVLHPRATRASGFFTESTLRSCNVL